tara:strand:+ start:6731 stop:7549 length:819 start_codon:yes stop_codon:yes gene_type:complete
MGFELDDQSSCILLPRMVVFDLEFVGDLTTGVPNCYLWNIGAVHIATGSTFNIVMDPAIRPFPPTHDKCVQVNEEFLLEQRAVPLKDGLELFFAWLGCNNVLIAHNNFKSDKMVLEQACTRAGVQCPLIYFMDSLLLMRNSIKHPSYKLSALYQHYMCKEFEESHQALPDALALRDVLMEAFETFTGAIIYPTHSTPLQNIRWVGPACERAMMACHFNSVEALKQHIWDEYCAVSIFYTIPFRSCISKVVKDMGLPVQNIMPIVDEIAKLFT